ncbi:hypothetical protein [Hyalangium minutum]|uniref:Uncharacterized protein n=1 Tax=Hyalangium minutum TaxID=394096 RepID=A0A085W5D0_9BACT|nr:hypothetical protein [Hyalangium minutum]KFE62893.1 hypothetical protein DB31_2952 [Hyalangium minutum]
MLDFIKNAVNTLAGPMATIVDFAGDKLGLPPLLTNSIKAAAGALTGNVMMAASGALGVVSELTKNPAAQTEFYPAQDAAKAQEGYAPAKQQAASAASTGYLEPSVLQYQEALRTIAANFGMLDTLNSKQNSKFDLSTLQKAAENPNLSPELRSAARFLLEHPEYRNMLDTAGKGGSADGTISQLDVQRALKKVNDDIAQYGVRQPSTSCPAKPPPVGTPSNPGTPGTPSCPAKPPPVGTPSNPGTPGTPVETKPPSTGQPSPPVESAPAPKPGGCGRPSSSVSDIINSPNMSMEEKLQALLTLITQDTDDEILDVMKEMSNARDERAKLGTDESGRTRAAKLETTMEQLNLRLQKLMEKRKQMFDLMSNISSKFNEMAKQAIQNLGRA